MPAGGRRLLQRAAGYRATLVAGQITYRDGEATGVLPGRLLRGGTSGLKSPRLGASCTPFIEVTLDRP